MRDNRIQTDVFSEAVTFGLVIDHPEYRHMNRMRDRQMIGLVARSLFWARKKGNNG